MKLSNKKPKTEVQEFHSMKEFEKNYYPEAVKKQPVEISDPILCSNYLLL